MTTTTSTPHENPTKSSNSDGGDNSQKNPSLSERFQQAQALIETSSSSPQDAISSLTQLQEDVSSLDLFSHNDSLEDIGTKSLPLLALEHFLALAHVRGTFGTSTERRAHVETGLVLLASFLHRLEQLELLSKDQMRDYHELLHHDQHADDGGPDGGSHMRGAEALLQQQQREAKIAHFRAKREMQQDMERLESLRQRRGRLGTEPQEEMDGYDEETLERTVAIRKLSILASEALEEWQQAYRELPMLEMAIQMEKQRADRERHLGASGEQDRAAAASPAQGGGPPLPSGKPFQLTHITKDSTTGQLKIRKEEMKSQVFRPGWNQPTMSLQEFAEREMAEAKERDERQKCAEGEQKKAPRRYEQLVRDGMEDNAELVDASARVDREWDEFREANPRGSGNKMGDRGDRNF